MIQSHKPGFSAAAFLSSAGPGRRLLHFSAKDALFGQGDPADCVFHLQQGRARLSVVSQSGKEATIALAGPGEFVGEDALFWSGGGRNVTASAMTGCIALQISRDEMLRVLRDEPEFQDLFLKFLLRRNMRIQADLIDQLFNSSEKRLARILLLMAEFDKDGKSMQTIPKISQETLAEMIGTTRSRVSFFMNRFRKMGFISYNGIIRVHKSLSNVIMQDHYNDDVLSAGLPHADGLPRSNGTMHTNGLPHTNGLAHTNGMAQRNGSKPGTHSMISGPSNFA